MQEELSIKPKKKRRSEVEKLKIDMKGWNTFAIMRQNSLEEKDIPENQTVFRTFKEDLKHCKEVLSKMGFSYTFVRTEREVFSKQETPLALQAVVKSTSQFNIIQDNEVNMQEQ